MVTAEPCCRRRTSRASEAGYNLVILVVAITVLNILVAAAIPLWRSAIRRDKEEELIFRGFQYAEAIRVFNHRFGRLPVRLEELIEAQPRSIRKLWADPITGKRDWVLIRVGPAGGNVPNPPAEGDQGEATNPPPTAPDGSVGLGPIRGVRSRSNHASIKVMFNQNRYDKWEFTVDLLSEQAASFGGVGVPATGGLGTRLPARWIGRPFRPGLSAATMPANPPPQPGTSPAPPANPPDNPPPEDEQ
jgi:type II secretory pathway pseudopilin PulG